MGVVWAWPKTSLKLHSNSDMATGTMRTTGYDSTSDTEDAPVGSNEEGGANKQTTPLSPAHSDSPTKMEELCVSAARSTASRVVSMVTTFGL